MNKSTKELFVTGGEMTEFDDGMIVRQDFSADTVGGRRANVRLTDREARLENIQVLLKAWQAICGRPGWEPDGDPTTAEAFLRHTQGRAALHARAI